MTYALGLLAMISSVAAATSPVQADEFVCPPGVPLCSAPLPEYPAASSGAKKPQAASKPRTATAPSKAKPSAASLEPIAIDVGSKPLPSPDQVIFAEPESSENQVTVDSPTGGKRLRKVDFTADSLKSKKKFKGLSWDHEPEPKTALTCFNTWMKTDADGNLTQESTGYTGPTFEQVSSNPNTTEAQIEAARAKMDRCLEEQLPSERELARELSRKIHEEAVTQHGCPKSFKDIDVLKRLTSFYLMHGYDSTQLPSIGAKAFICGYNSSWNTWYDKSAWMRTGPDTIVDQCGTNLAYDCQKSIRDPENPSVFFVNQPLCDGETSYRQGGNVGDFRFIPLGNKVWIRIAFIASDIFYYGVLIEP